LAIRADLARAHQDVWASLGRPGIFWTGQERVAMIAELRAARNCALCRKRKEALSPNMVSGAHDAAGSLPAPAIDAVHRIVSDPGRLTKSWLDKLKSDGLDEGAYVELVGTVILAIATESFDEALGRPRRALPAAQKGAPTGAPVQGLAEEGAWVKTVPAQIGLKGPNADSYFVPVAIGGTHVPFVNRALSQTPDSLRSLARFAETGYIAFPDVGNIPAYPKYGRALIPTQIELVSSRLSTLNGCFY
jgi:hypothetical protein